LQSLRRDKASGRVRPRPRHLPQLPTAQQREHDRRAALAEDEESHPEPSVDRWLLERGFAEQRDGELVATDAGRELGAVFGE
jgi:hypothetical protein